MMSAYAMFYAISFSNKRILLLISDTADELVSGLESSICPISFTSSLNSF
jgi:hypothetical protein